MIPISKDLRDDLPSLLMIRLLFKPSGVSPAIISQSAIIVLMPNTNCTSSFPTNQELYIVQSNCITIINTVSRYTQKLLRKQFYQFLRPLPSDLQVLQCLLLRLRPFHLPSHKKEHIDSSNMPRDLSLSVTAVALMQSMQTLGVER